LNGSGTILENDNVTNKIIAVKIKIYKADDTDIAALKTDDTASLIPKYGYLNIASLIKVAAKRRKKEKVYLLAIAILMW